MSGYALGEQAKRDIDEIWSYIAEDNETAADHIVDSFFKQFEILAANPRIGRRRQEFRLDYRSIACDEYVIFYRVRDPDVLIVRIVHGRRNLARIRNRRFRISETDQRRIRGRKCPNSISLS